MVASEIMKRWKPGSYGDDWTWRQERDDLTEMDKIHITLLMNDVQENGFRQPVLLGNDGRVWDGHHRIIVGWVLGLPILCEIVRDNDQSSV